MYVYYTCSTGCFIRIDCPFLFKGAGGGVSVAVMLLVVVQCSLPYTHKGTHVQMIRFFLLFLFSSCFFDVVGFHRCGRGGGGEGKRG